VSSVSGEESPEATLLATPKPMVGSHPFAFFFFFFKNKLFIYIFNKFIFFLLRLTRIAIVLVLT